MLLLPIIGDRDLQAYTSFQKKSSEKPLRDANFGLKSAFLFFL